MSRTLQVAVVGHTNTGKTSLLRTLMRDTGFGEVSDAPATTRGVEGAGLLADGEEVMALYDTPGLEDAAAVREWLEAHGYGPSDEAEGMRQFLESAEAGAALEQEAKVFRQLLASDVGLYVIDAREPVLGKYRDELAALRACAKPLIPVLNFVASADARDREWRDALAELSLHAVIAFDTVVYDADSEQRLFEKLLGMLDAYRAPLSRLMVARREEAARLHAAALRRIAELAIDVAACVQLVPGDRTDAAREMSALRDAVRAHEQQCVDDLLTLHGFAGAEHVPESLPMTDGQWDADLFTPEALREFGISAGRAGAVGAAAGFMIDVATVGLTLGAGTAGGAAAGALWGSRRGLGRRVWRRLQGRHELRVAEPTLQLLVVRQLSLVAALRRRGHGATDAIRGGPAASAPWRDGRGPSVLHRAQAHPEWSRLNPASGDPRSSSRDAAIGELARWLEQLA